MLFEKIYINNLFSYYGESEFDLAMPENKGNVVVISGRNGYGKTSFINSIKLLFGGPVESLRLIHTGWKLSEQLYILGQGDKWLGIINRKAREKGQKHFGIRINWQEKNGTVMVERSWLLTGKNSYESRLNINASFLKEDLEGDKAQEFLNEYLPQDYIPYFFFDCEQIQALAEDNQKVKLEHMERILDIAPIDTLCEHIGIVARQLKKDAMIGDALLEQTQLENKKKELLAQKTKITEEKEEIEDEIIEIEDKIAEEDRYINSMRSLNIIRNEDKLKEQRKNLQERIEELTDDFAIRFPAEAPLLINLPLVKTAILELRKLLKSETIVQIGIIQSFLENLPSDLLDKPPHPNPPLTENQKQFYKKRLIQLINAYVPDSENIADTLLSIDINLAQKITEKLIYYAQADELRIEFAQRLRLISQRKNELYAIEQKLDDVSSLSVEVRDDYLRRKGENDDRRESLGKLREKIKNLESNITFIEKEIKNIDKRIEQQQNQVKLNKQAGKKVELAKKLRNFFGEYKDELKKLRREEIETAINIHFKELMTSHPLINHIRVEEDFALSYEDRRNNPIGMANLSAGMKQLAATALLWALKDVSGKTIPLIIDTPLARIDREHQENLLRRYYPVVGEQVIILPTDSELDRNKYSILKPHIYKEYRLENSDGESTRIKMIPMYRSE